jgi:RNA-directed DNA polymerase
MPPNPASAAPKTLADLAKLLGVSAAYLKVVLRKARRYRTFHIPKKTGGHREIASPTPPIRFLQRKLLAYLETLYQGRSSAHGFIKGRSIRSNAEPHAKSRFVLNIDLENFFPTIHFGRIRGMLMSKPYYLGKQAAQMIADLCCRNRVLPQGAPTSPILANMVCAQMDSQLKALAKKYHCMYTRYADDLSFSTKARSFPKALARIPTDEGGQLDVGDELLQLIIASGFRVNTGKIRIATRHERQEVTGLTTNRFPNVPRRFVRQIRAMLHAWKTFGLDKAQQEFWQKYDKRKGRLKPQPAFANVVRGKIEFVGSIRGKADPLYWRLLGQYAKLDPSYQLEEPDDFVESDVRELKRAVVVLRDRSGQSTAFYLKGFGLVTCSHAITDPDSLQIVRADDPLETEYPVKLLARDIKLDLAILESPIPAVKELRLGDDTHIKQRDTVRLLGFPQHHKAADVSIYEGDVVHDYQVEDKVRRFHISCPIIQGNSGGPLLNVRNQVVGVAVKGGIGELNGVVPISYLFRLQIPKPGGTVETVATAQATTTNE